MSDAITSPRELHDELAAVVDRSRVGGLDRHRRDEPAQSAPDDDEPWSVADILAEMMSGAYAHGARVDLFGYQCYNATIDETANVWTIHSPDGGRAIDAINLSALASAAEIENYLLDIVEREPLRVVRLAIVEHPVPRHGQEVLDLLAVGLVEVAFAEHLVGVAS